MWPVREHPGDDTQVVVGAALANKLNLHKGSSFAVESAEARAAGITPNPWYVTGIVSTGDATENELLVPLDAEGSPENNPISRVEISARTKPEDAFARKAPDTPSSPQRPRDLVLPAPTQTPSPTRSAKPSPEHKRNRSAESNNPKGNVLKRISGLMWLISAAALLAAGFAVSAAMATAVLERRGEIGLCAPSEPAKEL